ncbi:MAG: TRAP transporter large permease [Alphaproteobacteria bacterium]
MSGVEIGALSILAMLFLVLSGMHVVAVLIVVSFGSLWIMRGDAGLAGRLLGQAAANGIENYVFGVIPLFVLMGIFVSVSGIGRDTFDVANAVFRRVLGGLGVATVFANAVFAALTGVSIASAAIFTRVAVPEMLRFGYTARFSVGVVAGSSVLGMLIPPSLLFILYAILSGESIGDMFLAGVLPGLLLTGTYAAAIVLAARYAPGWVFAGGVSAGAAAASLLPAEPAPGGGGSLLAKAAPIVVLIALVLGGIYGGVFTPTEAGAAGALAAFVLAGLKRSLTPGKLWRIFVETGHVTASICIIIMAAAMYSRMLTLSGLPAWISGGIVDAGLGLHGTLALYLLVLLVLGCILDSASIMLITLPLFLPIFEGFGVDLVWFGVITVVTVEIGLLTPPLGLICYVLKSTLDDQKVTLQEIFRGALPFAGLMAAVLVVLVAVPWFSRALL